MAKTTTQDYVAARRCRRQNDRRSVRGCAEIAVLDRGQPDLGQRPRPSGLPRTSVLRLYLNGRPEGRPFSLRVYRSECQDCSLGRLRLCQERPGCRRRLLWFEVTRHPTAEWLARQITEAFPWASAPAYLVRDNDRAYGHVFTSRVRAMGIRDRPTSPGSPWQNGCAERLIGTLRRECLDQMLIFGERHLRRVLSAYAAYYNQARTHLALQKDAPLHRAIQRSGAIVAIPIMTGLHHQYVRI